MKTYKKFIISCFAILAFAIFAGSVNATTLSQTSVSLTVGQSSTIYAYNVSSSVYLSTNSSPSVATVSVSGSNINIYGIASGSTNATICDSQSGCSTLYITVNGNNSGTLSLSQTNVSLSVGQTTTVTSNNYYNYGTLYISNNSNSGVATASISGNVVSIYGSSTGSSNITICQNYNSVSCGTVYITVGGYNYNGSTTGFNLSNLTLPIGSSATISPSNYNYSNYYSNTTGLYVSSNSNPSVASTSLSSAIPGCYGTNQYSTTTGQLCNSTTAYSYYNTSYISGCYGTNQYSTTTGQLCYGGGSTSSSGSVVITAVSTGSDVITVCQNGSTCNTLNITVIGNYSALNSSYYNSYNNSGIPTVYSNSSAN